MLACIDTESVELNIIYPILIIEKLFDELLQTTIDLLSEIISYYFYDIKGLCNILHTLFN